jgi:hypothetical protein
MALGAKIGPSAPPSYAEQGQPLPRTTVDWDTSQADDFRTRGVPWTIKRTLLERGRALRSDRKSLAQRRSGAVAGCRDSARLRRCCVGFNPVSQKSPAIQAARFRQRVFGIGADRKNPNGAELASA